MELVEGTTLEDSIYVEAHENEWGIVLCCDVCRDQARDRIVKQLGWTVKIGTINEAVQEHMEMHPVVSLTNEVTM